MWARNSSGRLVKRASSDETMSTSQSTDCRLTRPLLTRPLLTRPLLTRIASWTTEDTVYCDDGVPLSFVKTMRDGASMLMLGD